MPKIHHSVEQGSEEWLRLRLGKVTASELGNIVTPKFAVKTGETYRKYLYEKVAETWRGDIIPGFTSWQTDQGHIREDEAWRWFSLEYDVDVERVGFVETDDGRCGCSPDGLIGDDSGLELKAPECVNAVKYLVEGVLPEQYAAQVHGSLYVTGRKRWNFMSYRRGFPAFVIQVERDESIIGKIATALAGFYADFDAALATVKERAA